MEELTFLEAVKIFKVDVNEKAIPLHGLHHSQIEKALENFSEKSEAEKGNILKVNPYKDQTRKRQ